MDIEISSRFRQIYPEACCGFLAVEYSTVPVQSTALDASKDALQDELRRLYPDGVSIKTDPVIQAYTTYYKPFKKTYHVALQIESVALKGKSIPSASPLVQCMFMAELKNRLLTAGHDLDVLRSAGGRITVDVAQGDESYTLLRGVPQTLKAGDQFMKDGVGIISSIIYGPDQRTQITPETTSVLYTIYAPAGIGRERVREHLESIKDYGMVIDVDARVLLMEVKG